MYTHADSHAPNHIRAYTHMGSCSKAQARKTYPFYQKAEKMRNECRAYSRHTCNNFMAWQKPRLYPHSGPGAMVTQRKIYTSLFILSVFNTYEFFIHISAI